ncbi:MAG TPA: shikimate 5-dehydrogenase [Nakamurella sp.]
MPTTDTLNKSTALCVSLAARPSNIGTRFHNHLYDELGLDFVYKAFAPTDIVAAVAGIRGLGIRGAGVSMPYKADVMPLIDELDASATAIQSVNTIVNTDGHLTGYNTDYIAVRSVLAGHEVPTDLDFLLLGSGGMAKAIVAALRDAGFGSGTIVAPQSVDAGRALADQYGYRFAAELGDLAAPLLINATPIGMTGGPAENDLSFERDLVEQAQVVFDVVAFPSKTPLISLATDLGKPTISGAEIIALQAAEQFVLYTGVRPSDDQLRRAAEFSRA